MPTLIDLDGFAHQTAQTTQAGSGFTGTYGQVNRSAGISFDTTNKRLGPHIASLKVVEDGSTATNVLRSLAAGHRLLVGSIYFRVTTAPSVASDILRGTGPTNFPRFTVNTNGTISAGFGGGTVGTSGASIADSNWHLLDYRIDVSGSTFTLDWQLDASAQTQASRTGQTAADLSSFALGSGTTTHTLTAWYQDHVLSFTTGDYPIGTHTVLPLYPTGEGTDALGSTNAIQDEGGAQSNLYQHADDWNGGTPDTSTYVTYASTATGDAASNYAEFTLSDPTGSTVWDVVGYIAGFAAGTAADTADTKVVLSDATLVDHIGNLIDYSGSTTVLGYARVILARPSGGWTVSNLTGTKIRWGFSTDTNPQPRLSAVMLEYAGPQAGQDVTGAATISGSGSVSISGTHEGIGAGTLAGSGSIAASGTRTTFGAATLAASGSLTASGTHQGVGAATLAASGSLAAAGTHQGVGAATLAGSGSLAATGVVGKLDGAGLIGQGSLTADGVHEAVGAAVLEGVGDLDATGILHLYGAADLLGEGTELVDGFAGHFGEAILEGEGSLAIIGTGRVRGPTRVLVGATRSGASVRSTRNRAAANETGNEVSVRGG